MGIMFFQASWFLGIVYGHCVFSSTVVFQHCLWALWFVKCCGFLVLFVGNVLSQTK